MILDGCAIDADDGVSCFKGSKDNSVSNATVTACDGDLHGIGES